QPYCFIRRAYRFRHVQRGIRTKFPRQEPRSEPKPEPSPASAGPARLLYSRAVMLAVVLPVHRRARPRWRPTVQHRPSLLVRRSRAVAAVRTRLSAALRSARAAAQPRTHDVDARSDAGAASRLSRVGYARDVLGARGE